MNADPPRLTVDCIIFEGDNVVLIRRKNPPFENTWALPGGFVENGETVEQACSREVKEETNLNIRNLRLIGVYSDPNRDPRGHTVTVAFLAEADVENMQAASDAKEVALVADWKDQELAFDHRIILQDALKPVQRSHL